MDSIYREGPTRTTPVVARRTVCFGATGVPVGMLGFVARGAPDATNAGIDAKRFNRFIDDIPQCWNHGVRY